MWYHLFLAACLLLALFGEPAQRRLWFIIMTATILSMLMGVMGLDRVTSHWKLIPYAGLEAATIAALYGLAWCSPSRLQAIVLTVAWLVHVTCWIDCEFGTSIIFDHYVQALQGIAVAQLLIGWRGFLRMATMVIRYMGAAGEIPGLGPLLDPSGADRVVLHPPQSPRHSSRQT